MNLTRIDTRTGGYSLMELMLVLTLLAIFAGMANRLFMQCVVINRDVVKASNSLIQADSLIRLIRSDVWGARSVSSNNPGQVTLGMADGTVVRWERRVTHYGDDEIESLIYRMETAYGVEVTGDPLFAPNDLVFRADGTDLYLTSGRDSIRLTCAFGLLEGAQQ